MMYRYIVRFCQLSSERNCRTWQLHVQRRDCCSFD